MAILVTTSKTNSEFFKWLWYIVENISPGFMKEVQLLICAWKSCYQVHPKLQLGLWNCVQRGRKKSQIFPKCLIVIRVFCKTGNKGQKPMVIKIHTWNICTRNVVTHFYTSAVSKMRANTSGFGALISMFFLFCARSVNKRSSRYNNNVQLRDYASTMIFIIMFCHTI